MLLMKGKGKVEVYHLNESTHLLQQYGTGFIKTGRTVRRLVLV